MTSTVHTHGRWGERIIHSSWRWIFFPLWCIYRPVVGLRNVLYDIQWKHSYRLKVPVISVGNIIAGGSGKTPLVEKITALLSKQGNNVHVLSRGYKSNDQQENEEAQLISVPVHCNSKRFIAGKEAIQQGAHILVLDDGFRHRQLHRDLDIVLIDATRPWGFHSDSKHARSRAMLPLGFLREPATALKRADLIVLTRCNQCSKQQLEQLRNQCSRFNKMLACCEHQTSHLTKLADEEIIPHAQVNHKPAILISGIAHPQSFEQSAHSLNFTIKAHHQFEDHHHFNRKDVESILQLYKGQEISMVCTSKDAVKLRELWPTDAIPCFVLHIGIVFLDNDLDVVQQALETYNQKH
ncbi:MAG: tetraacyldisaccharide 4'-kinase [Planctomycetes bacterium]|nr:tetraacyldisaccharide 4'-kinase [Planctomycetota bacterium]